MKINKWYIIAKEDKKAPFGYKTITPKGVYYQTGEEANIDRIYCQPDYEEKLVILERTCKIIKM